MKRTRQIIWTWIPWLRCYEFRCNDYETMLRADENETAYDCMVADAMNEKGYVPASLL